MSKKYPLGGREELEVTCPCCGAYLTIAAQELIGDQLYASLESWRPADSNDSPKFVGPGEPQP